jgi:hypothetical protein
MAVIAEIDHEACDELVAELRPLRAVSLSTVTAARAVLIALSVSRAVGKRTSSKRGPIS